MTSAGQRCGLDLAPVGLDPVALEIAAQRADQRGRRLSGGVGGSRSRCQRVEVGDDLAIGRADLELLDDVEAADAGQRDQEAPVLGLGEAA